MTTPCAPKIICEKESRNAVFSDYVRMAWSQTTFNIEFSQAILLEEGDTEPKCKYLDNVLMSPQQAKLFFLLFKDQLEKYEKAFGEIKVKQ